MRLPARLRSSTALMTVAGLLQCQGAVAQSVPADASATVMPDSSRFDPGTTAPHTSYIVHHNGPQYFGYLADNTQELLNLHGLDDFFVAMSAKALPNSGGVFYVRGGYNNLDGLKPVDPNTTVQASFPGNDDHPAYSDSQISEALLADEINAIAMSPYWSQSAIVITYDETSGYYHHAAFTPRSYAPDGGAYAGGQRIPAIVISPYAQANVALHAYAEHSSVIKFINNLFHAGRACAARCDG